MEINKYHILIIIIVGIGILGMFEVIKSSINEAVDPITKEDIDKNKCLKYENNEIIFCK